MTGTVVLLSGGIDSTVLLTSLKKAGNKLFAFIVDYSQSHSREIRAAAQVAKALEVEYTIYPLTRGLFAPSALTGNGIAPAAEYSRASLQRTIVPGRNLVFISLAAAFAESVRCSQVAIAVHSGDHPIYPDCRVRFVKAAQKAVYWSSGGKVELIAPFVNFTKAQVVELGRRLQAPFELTYSCYRGGPKHCGVCSTCRERRLAFRLNYMEDPTEYESDTA